MSKPKRIHVPKPVLAMAAPPAEHALVSIDRLKGGELVWTVRVPGRSLPQTVDRAIAEAKRLDAELRHWRETEERRRVAALLNKSLNAKSHVFTPETADAKAVD